MTDLPDSLLRFERQLERAVERDRLRRRRRPSRLVLRLTAATAVSASIAFGALALFANDQHSLPGPSFVPTASAAERAAAVLAPGGGSIVHEIAATRDVAADGSVTRWRDETWRQTTAPYAQRQVTTRPGGIRVETATSGDRREIYDPATNTIYTNAPRSPAPGTPEPAADGDPMRAQLAAFLRSDDVRDVTRTTRDGRPVIRFRLENAWPDGTVVTWSYVVDAADYAPIQLTASSPAGRTTTRFLTYEAVKPGRDTETLLSVRAQHPDAVIDDTQAGYRAAQARTLGSPTPERTR